MVKLNRPSSNVENRTKGHVKLGPPTEQFDRLRKVRNQIMDDSYRFEQAQYANGTKKVLALKGGPGTWHGPTREFYQKPSGPNTRSIKEARMNRGLREIDDFLTEYATRKQTPYGR